MNRLVGDKSRNNDRWNNESVRIIITNGMLRDLFRFLEKKNRTVLVSHFVLKPNDSPASTYSHRDAKTNV